MNTAFKRILGIPLYPFLRYFGPRFENIHARLDQTNHQLVKMEERLAEFERRVVTDVETTLEIFVTLQRSAAALERRLAENSPNGEADLMSIDALEQQVPRP